MSNDKSCFEIAIFVVVRIVVNVVGIPNVVVDVERHSCYFLTDGFEWDLKRGRWSCFCHRKHQWNVQRQNLSSLSHDCVVEIHSVLVDR